MRRVKKRTIFTFIICLTWLFVIFAFSAMDADSSSSITNTTLERVDLVRSKSILANFVFEKLTEEYSIFFIVRKMAHMFVFCILEIIVFTLFRTLNLSFAKSAIFSISIVFGYACLDEFHQLFVDGRSGQFTDVMIDTIGGFIGLFITSFFTFLIAIFKKNKKKGFKSRIL